jgi:hypothetical protein
MPRGHHRTGRGRDHERDHHAGHHQPQRHLEAVGDLRADRRLGDVREAEVAVQHAAKPVDVLRANRPVESELATQLGHGLVGRVHPERDASRVTGQDREEAEDQHRADRQADQ